MAALKKLEATARRMWYWDSTKSDEDNSIYLLDELLFVRHSVLYSVKIFTMQILQSRTSFSAEVFSLYLYEDVFIMWFWQYKEAQKLTWNQGKSIVCFNSSLQQSKVLSVNEKSSSLTPLLPMPGRYPVSLWAPEELIGRLEEALKSPVLLLLVACLFSGQSASCSSQFKHMLHLKKKIILLTDPQDIGHWSKRNSVEENRVHESVCVGNKCLSFTADGHVLLYIYNFCVSEMAKQFCKAELYLSLFSWMTLIKCQLLTRPHHSFLSWGLWLLWTDPLGCSGSTFLLIVLHPSDEMTCKAEDSLLKHSSPRWTW